MASRMAVCADKDFAVSPVPVRRRAAHGPIARESTEDFSAALLAYHLELEERGGVVSTSYSSAIARYIGDS